MKRKPKPPKRTNTCQWCGRGFPTATAHMIHVTEDHPETIGRGRTMSKLWSCPRLGCGHENPPVVDECAACGYVNADLKAQNAKRAFTVHRRRLDGSVWVSRPTSAFAARYTLASFPAMYLETMGEVYTLDTKRQEVLAPNGDRVGWLELAVVEETSNYIPPKGITP
jgi:hypothetical protein